MWVLVPAIAGTTCIWGLLQQYWTGPVLSSGTDAVVSVLTMILCIWVLQTMLRYYRPAGGKEWILFVWIVTIGLVWLGITCWGQIIFSQNKAYVNFIEQTLWLRLFLALMSMTCGALLAWLRKQNSEILKREKHWTEIRQLAKESELHSLRQQMQPHFLFNSLNSIHSMVTREPEKARAMVLNLSGFLRGTLGKEMSKPVKLETEINQTRLYLDIEMVRFPDLKTEWSVPENCLNCEIPVLILQPLVENAVKYSRRSLSGKWYIHIAAELKDEVLEIKVSNPIDPELQNTEKGTGFGLSAIGRRLFLLFGRNDLLQTYNKENIYYTELKIPQIHEKSNYN
ncbi:MAG: histidine kinase [Bacteroidetes bacterium]|nr:histidine kinase [Bacteroidota bacterium]